MPLHYAQRVALSLVVATIAATWFLSGVAVGEAARFVAFEALYVVLPGCSLYLALSSNSGGRLRTLAIGWPLGYAIEVGAFALTASLHHRAVFALLPFISGAPLVALLVRARRRRHLRKPRPTLSYHGQPLSTTSVELVFVAMAISAALVLIALTLFTAAPLPGHIRSVAYPSESVYAIALAAEARNHWPITIPWVAGLPLHYYTAVFMHGAAINEISRVSLSTIYLRLFPTTATLILALQLWSLGRSMGRSRLAGPLAVILFFLVSAATLNPRRAWAFEGNSLGTFWGSATFTFAALFLLALLSLLQHWLADTGTLARLGRMRPGSLPRSDARALIVIAVLVLGCGAAKTFAAIDFVGGLGLFLLWGAFTRKLRGRIFWLLTYSFAVSTVCLGVIYATMLTGGGGKFVGIQPLNTVFAESLFTQARAEAQSLVGHSVLWVFAFGGGVVLVVACLSAPILGAIWLLLRRSTLSSFEVFCLAVVLAGLAGYYVTYGHAAGAEIYPRYFGYFALVLVAAGGLADFLSDTPKNARRPVVKACGVVLVFGLMMAGGPYLLGLSRHMEYLWYPAMYGLLAGVVTIMVLRLRRYYRPLIFTRMGSVVACCIALLGVLGLVRSMAIAAVRAKSTILHQRIAPPDTPSAFGMTGALYRGLVWVRAHSRGYDVLAVNNHYASPFRGPATYLYYSAFTERRIFLESWADTPSGVEGTSPFPGRLALNDSATLRGDPGALRELGRDGVSYVLIDKTHGGGAREPTNVSRLVFSNSALDVYRLLPRVSAARQPRSQPTWAGRRAANGFYRRLRTAMGDATGLASQ